MRRIYRINTGSCGGCDVEAAIAVADNTSIVWVSTPQEADLLLLTGPITPGSKAAFQKIVQGAADKPLLALGRCAIDGHPFGKGGIEELADSTGWQRVQGCPPEPDAIIQALEALQAQRQA